MREDMSKVLVESPRSGRSMAKAMRGTHRQRRNRLDPDGESAPGRAPIVRNGEKHFGEHLAPLFRYLDGQADRPWSKVYGELCAKLDRRSVVQSHLFLHIRNHVEVETVWRDGEVWCRQWRGVVPIAESRTEMFVHPVTGILLPNRARAIAQRKRNAARALQRATPHPDRRAGLPGMAPDVRWQRIDGLWFELTMRELGRDIGWDVVLKRAVDGRHRTLLEQAYGCPCSYAIAKRQLGSDVLRKHGLESSAE